MGAEGRDNDDVGDVDKTNVADRGEGGVESIGNGDLVPNTGGHEVGGSRSLDIRRIDVNA